MLTLDGDQADVSQVLHLDLLSFRLELGHLSLEVLHVRVFAGAVHHLVAGLRKENNKYW